MAKVDSGPPELTRPSQFLPINSCLSVLVLSILLLEHSSDAVALRGLTRCNPVPDSLNTVE